MAARLYNPCVYHVTQTEALKSLEFYQKHPLLYTFHPSIVKAAALAKHIITTGGSGNLMKAALLLAYQISLIFDIHGLEMLVTSYVPYCEWFGYCNRIAMIGICVKRHVEFYPITYQLWDEEDITSTPPSPVLSADSADAAEHMTSRTDLQHEQTMPASWPPVANSSKALAAMARDIYRNKNAMPARPRSFHSCDRCDQNGFNGALTFVHPEYILESSSHVPTTHRTDELHSVNYICPGFVDKFVDLVFKLHPDDYRSAIEDMEFRSSSLANTSHTWSEMFAQQEEDSSSSKASSVSSFNPQSSETFKEPGEGEVIPVVSIPCPTATNISHAIASIISLLSDCPKSDPIDASCGSGLPDVEPEWECSDYSELETVTRHPFNFE